MSDVPDYLRDVLLNAHQIGEKLGLEADQVRAAVAALAADPALETAFVKRVQLVRMTGRDLEHDQLMHPPPMKESDKIAALEAEIKRLKGG